MNLAVVRYSQSIQRCNRYGIDVLWISSLVLFFLFSKQSFTTHQRPDESDAMDKPIQAEILSSFCFCGRNMRPDQADQKPIFCLLSLANGQTKNVQIGAKLFLQTKNHTWLFIDNQRDAVAWIEINNATKDTLTALFYHMQKEFQKPIQIVFKRCAIDAGQQNASILQVASVSAKLLEQQEITWYGQDLFLEEHDTSQQSAKYTLYMQKRPMVTLACGEKLAWTNDSWSSAENMLSTQEYPLLTLEKIVENSLFWTLWDRIGTNSFSLNLPRSIPATVTSDIFSDWTRLQIHSLTKSSILIGEKMHPMEAKDWWVREQGEWKKLSSAEQIEKYVSQQTIGELFVCDGIALEGGKQILRGHLFNPERTLRYQFKFYEKEQKIVLILDSLL